MIRTYALGSLRLSLLAAIGATTTAACGSSTEIGGGSGGASTKVCAGAVAVAQPDGAETGFFTCADGTTNRAVQATCSTTLSGQACRGDEATTSCLTDADCTERLYGNCLHSESVGPGGSMTSCGCSYACANDGDCDEGQVCACAGVHGDSHCIPATCGTNADCPSGECSLSVYNDGCSTTASLHCRTTTDACRTAEDCPGDAYDIQCAVDYGNDQFACLTSNCAIGRPLMVDGSARATRATERVDWRNAELTPNLDGLSPEIVAALASRWQDVAAMEHASVASFARFTLQLMALGAPADLLADTQRAASDEVEHARMAYAVASTYAGRSIGPDALDLADVRIETDRDTVLRGLIEEACVGEAIGVAEALAYADAAEDPTIAALLTRVADEEQRHAALAWRALRWMLHGANERTLGIAREAFERATQNMRREPVVRGPVAREHGLWSAAQIASVRRHALDEVVLPCARALLDDLANEGAGQRNRVA